MSQFGRFKGLLLPVFVVILMTAVVVSDLLGSIANMTERLPLGALVPERSSSALPLDVSRVDAVLSQYLMAAILIFFLGVISLLLLVLFLQRQRRLDVIRRHEQQLRASEELLSQRTNELAYREAVFSSLFDHSDFLIGVLDENLRLIEVNQNALDIIEMPAEKVIGRRFIDTPWWTEADKVKLNAVLDRALNGSMGSLEAVHPRPDGTWITDLFHALPVRVGERRLVTVIGMDISDRKQAEAALEQSETQLRRLFELAPIGIALNDLETGAFLEINSALYAPAGYTQKEFTSLCYWDLTPLRCTQLFQSS